MTPVQAIIDTIATALASDVAFLASVTANQLYLVGAAFVPSPFLTVADLVLIDGDTLDGLDSISVTAGAQTVVADSGSLARGIYLKEPAGGFRWVAAADPDSPIVCYGVALTTNDGLTLLASALFSSALQIAAELDVIQVSAEFGWFLPQPVQGPIIAANGVPAPPGP